jgi:hypothetical protein
VSTIWFPSVQPLDKDTGRYMALLFTSAISTEEIRRQGETDVDAGLPRQKTWDRERILHVWGRGFQP